MFILPINNIFFQEKCIQSSLMCILHHEGFAGEVPFTIFWTRSIYHLIQTTVIPCLFTLAIYRYKFCIFPAMFAVHSYFHPTTESKSRRKNFRYQNIYKYKKINIRCENSACNNNFGCSDVVNSILGL